MKLFRYLIVPMFSAVLLAACGSPPPETAPAVLPPETAAVTTAAAPEETLPAETKPDISPYREVLDTAALLAAQYDYDAAIGQLQTIPDYDIYAEVTEAIGAYEAEKAACLPVDPETVPHVFFHSLIVDTDRCFDVEKWGKTSVDGYNAWMVTIGEFEKIMQQLYDAGYVYVMLSDLYVKTENADGTVTFAPNHDILLPPDKKALVLSLDDLSYYAQYAHRGFADKIVLDGEGRLKCQYTDAAGNVSVGDYDWLPICDRFFEAHPDACYHGAKGTIAMTGYDGVFGYRTDEGFFSNPTYEEQLWLDEFPDADLEEEIRQAKIIAEAIKADGWEFASHSWGHRPMGSKGLSWLQADTEKWLTRVAPIIGETDILIYPHGSDVEGLGDYGPDNEKYAFLKESGFNVFCNVYTAKPAWIQIRPDYVRQARIDIDGYMLYNAIDNDSAILSQLGLNAKEIFDDSVRLTPVIADGAE